ncbi:MAG TPA: glycosyltransferase [Nitrospirae bacterium]|nr:glycosyltransferase [Nitrospirota bacterium]
MKILQITTSFPPLIGGIETYSYNLAKGLIDKGLFLKVLTSVGEERTLNDTNDIHVVRTPSWLNIRYIKIIPLLLTAMFTCLIDRPDYVIAMTWRHEGVVAYLLKKLLKIKYIIVSHGTEITSVCDKYVHRALMTSVFGGAQNIIANSSFTKKTLANALKIDQTCIAVINPPLRIPHVLTTIDTSVIDRKYNLTGKRIILTVSRLVKRKNHALVIRLMADLKDLYPDLIYVITGEGEYQRQLKNLAYELSVEEQIIFVGFVSAEELEGLYQRSEIYVSP